MRYYAFVLNTNGDLIRENAKIKMHNWENPLTTMNNHMHTNIKNRTCFFAYREEENSVYASFSYEESMYSLPIIN